MLNKDVCLLYTVNLLQIKISLSAKLQLYPVRELDDQRERYFRMIYIVCHYLF